jgi:hypothetical protein
MDVDSIEPVITVRARFCNAIDQCLRTVRKAIGYGRCKHILFVGEQQVAGILEHSLVCLRSKSNLYASVKHVLRKWTNVADRWP